MPPSVPPAALATATLPTIIDVLREHISDENGRFDEIGAKQDHLAQRLARFETLLHHLSDEVLRLHKSEEAREARIAATHDMMTEILMAVRALPQEWGEFRTRFASIEDFRERQEKELEETREVERKHSSDIKGLLVAIETESARRQAVHATIELIGLKIVPVLIALTGAVYTLVRWLVTIHPPQ